MVNISKVAKIHEKLMYHDKCDIYSYVDSTDEDGATFTTLPKTATWSDVPCKVSFSLRSWGNFINRREDVIPYNKQPKIFLSTDYLIKPGDYFIVTRYNQNTGQIIATYEGAAGVPQVSLTHQEVLLDVKGNC